MAQLSLSLLGSPRVERNGVALRFDTRKAMALLACLALNEGALRRDTLATLLWPEYAQGRAALRRTLSALQAAIGDDWIISTGDDLALRRDPDFLIDVDRFQAHIAAAHTRDPATQRTELRAAVALYRDDLLAGFSLRDSPAFDDWQIAQAERFRHMFAEVLKQLSHLEATYGDWQEAISNARRWIALDPLHEEAYRTAMTIYAEAGQRSAAVQQYRECVRVLERELGVPPLEATTRLYHDIIAGSQPTLYGRPDLVAPAPTPDERPTVVAPTPTPALVGRAGEWAVLMDRHARLGPDGALIVLAGPAGIGKTRLATELLNYARSQGAVTLQARCFEGETGLAFAPFVALLRALGTRPDVAPRLAAVPDWLRSAAAHLVPELAERIDGLPPDTADARLRIFEGVAAVIFAATAGPAPALILLDDLHWADVASLELFAFLARRLHGRAVALIATWRNDELAPTHPLHVLLAALRRDGTATYVQLSPLSRTDVTALLSRASDSANVSPEAAERLFAETAGVPLLVVAYLDAIREQGLPAPSEPLALPTIARDLLQARLQRASPMGAQLLAAAAVIGRTFDSTILRAVSGRSDEELVAGLEELSRLGIVVEGEHYDFSHGTLRDLIYAETSLARRHLLHRRAAEALNQRPKGGPEEAQAALIAQHYQLAGESALAAQAFVRAGRQAGELAATETALKHYAAALALEYPDPGQIHSAIGDLYTLEGQYDLALTSYASATTLVHAADRASLEARIAEVHRRRGEWAEALHHLTAGLAALDQTDDPTQRARLTADQSLTTHLAGESAGAQRLAADALKLAEQAADVRALAQTHNLLGLLAHANGDYSIACTYLERSLALAEQLDDIGARTAALHNLALVRGASGQREAALAHARQALTLCKRQGDRHRAAAIHNTLADLLHAGGRVPEAMEELKYAVALFAAIGGAANRNHPGIWRLTAW